jgi:hypothetical protein
MIAKVENLVLDHLHCIRGQLDRMENDIRNIKGHSGPQIHVTIATQSLLLDRLDARVNRIEKRRNLAEG